MSKQDSLLEKLVTTDIIRLMEKLGIPETNVKYGNGCLIFPTICHNELINNPSHKLYYYELTKRFYCYTHCKAMSIYDMIQNVYNARGFKCDYFMARNMIADIIDNRMKTGFSIIQPPKIINYDKVEDGWEQRLAVYNENVLECFTQKPKFLQPWIKEGIDYEVLCNFGIRFDMIRNRMVIPVYDRLGRLVGIKVRNFDETDIEEGRKYMPLWHYEESYTYPKMMVLYGFYQNKETIRKAKEAIVAEAEKAVLSYGSFFTANKCVAIGGSAFSKYHGEILRQSDVKKIVLCLDNDYDEFGDRFYGLRKSIREAKRIKEMGFEVDIVYDWDGEFLGNKDSPFDKGRVVYSKLYRRRKDLDTVIKEYEEGDNNEIQTENNEL